MPETKLNKEQFYHFPSEIWNEQISKFKEYRIKFIKHLYKTGAVKFGDFRLKSGRLSPYFINMQEAMKDGQGCCIVGEAYADVIVDQHLADKADVIFGPAYKAIPLASLIARDLWRKYGVRKRWGYNRKEAKGYGDIIDQLIVGDLRDGDRILIVDDVLTTGETKKDIFTFLRNFRKVSLTGVVVGVNRQETFNLDFPVYSITNTSEIIKFLFGNNRISKEQLDTIYKYLESK